jgi:hypothetical protein
MMFYLTGNMPKELLYFTFCVALLECMYRKCSSYWNSSLVHCVRSNYQSRLLIAAPLLLNIYHKGSSITSGDASLYAVKFKRLPFYVRLASPYPLLGTRSFSCLTLLACTVSVSYGTFNVVCKSRIDVHLGKFPVVLKTGFKELY